MLVLRAHAQPYIPYGWGVIVRKLGLLAYMNI